MHSESMLHHVIPMKFEKWQENRKGIYVRSYRDFFLVDPLKDKMSSS